MCISCILHRGYISIDHFTFHFFWSNTFLNFRSKICCSLTGLHFFYGWFTLHMPSIRLRVEQQLAWFHSLVFISWIIVLVNLCFPAVSLIHTFLSNPGTAHCANMYPARSEDLPQLSLARDHIFLLLQQWLKQWLRPFSGFAKQTYKWNVKVTDIVPTPFFFYCHKHQ